VNRRHPFVNSGVHVNVPFVRRLQVHYDAAVHERHRVRFFGAAAILVWVTGASAGGVALVDRVVAVVDDAVVTRAEVEARARREVARAGTAAEGEAAHDGAVRHALDAMIDRILISRDARQRHLVVTDAEVARAMQLVAQQNHITGDQLLEAAHVQGIEPDAYRAELAYQILEAKWLQQAHEGDVPLLAAAPTDADRERWVSERRARLVAQLRAHAHVDVRL
jgi:SurA N-terminal domain